MNRIHKRPPRENERRPRGILPRGNLGGGYDQNVVGAELLEKVRYCHSNPITRGLAARSIDYRWSSARAYESLDALGPPIRFDLLPKSDRPLT